MYHGNNDYDSCSDKSSNNDSNSNDKNEIYI